MAPIDDAIAAIDARDSEDDSTLTEIADKFGVDRLTLGRKCKGTTTTQEAGYALQQKLNPQQESEPVAYIEELTKCALPPTRAMIRNFASEVAKERVSESWVTQFLNHNKDDLVSKWTMSMDRNRHQADSGFKYKLYFDLLHHKMEEYDVEPRNTYNMDKKGFLIGVASRSKRVFTRRQWKKKEVRASLQDGSREWITLLATVCANGKVLPPGLIYQSTNSTIQSAWVDAINARKHEVFVTSSPSGWSNNDVELAWLEQVFDRCTKAKARRLYRLLIVDGHGSHLTMIFLEYCHRNRILVAILPPHSTHTLQPLDVVMFKPLSGAYSSELTDYLHRSQGLVPIKKGNFFLLFWKAWKSSFKKELVLKSFEATGISPMDPEPILKRFNYKDEHEDEVSAWPPALNESNWNQMECLVRLAVKDTIAENSKQLSLALHHLQV
jgi:hypothetical protein